MSNLKIISKSGLSDSIEVYDSKGSRIEGIILIYIKISSGELIKATLEFENVELDLEDVVVAGQEGTNNDEEFRQLIKNNEK